MDGLRVAIAAMVLSVLSLVLLAYDFGEKRGFRDGYEIGRSEGDGESETELTEVRGFRDEE